MSTQTVAAPTGSPLLSQIRSLGETFALALRYRALLEMDDAQLAARGLTRTEVGQRFIDEAGRL